MDFVAVGQHRRVHRFPVDVGAVETANVDDSEFASFQLELGMPATDGDVVEEHIAAGIPPGGRDGLIQQEPRSGVGSTLDDKQGRAARKPFDFPRPRLGRRCVELVWKVSAETGGGLPITSSDLWSLSLCLTGWSLSAVLAA